MNATKRDFLEALKQAVMFSPESVGGACYQLQTFKVLEHGGGGVIRSSNFGGTICDKGKPFFWSRLWHNNKYNPNGIGFDFPALVVTETGYSVDSPLSRRNKRSYTFNISVMDKYVEAKGPKGCEGCNGRTINEIYEDTEVLLFQALHFVSKTTYAELSNGDKGQYNRDMLDAWVTLGYITGYTATKSIGAVLEGSVKNSPAYKASIPAEGLYGNSITITVDLPVCDETVWNFEKLPDFGVLSHEAGCTTCG